MAKRNLDLAVIGPVVSRDANGAIMRDAAGIAKTHHELRHVIQRSHYDGKPITLGELVAQYARRRVAVKHRDRLLAIYGG